MRTYEKTLFSSHKNIKISKQQLLPTQALHIFFCYKFIIQHTLKKKLFSLTSCQIAMYLKQKHCNLGNRSLIGLRLMQISVFSAMSARNGKKK